jgi:hypothetical protein
MNDSKNARPRAPGWVPGMPLMPGEPGYTLDEARAAVGPGWRNLVDRMWQVLGERVPVVQVKSKQGRLVMYVFNVGGPRPNDPALVERQLAEIEEESLRTPEWPEGPEPQAEDDEDDEDDEDEPHAAAPLWAPAEEAACPECGQLAAVFDTPMVLTDHATGRRWVDELPAGFCKAGHVWWPELTEDVLLQLERPGLEDGHVVHIHTEAGSYYWIVVRDGRYWLGAKNVPHPGHSSEIPEGAWEIERPLPWPPAVGLRFKFVAPVRLRRDDARRVPGGGKITSRVHSVVVEPI